MDDRKTAKLIGAFIVVCLVIAAIITISQLNSQSLPGYVEENSNTIVVTVAPYVATTEAPNMQLITDTSVGLSMHVPQGWSKVIKDGNTMYIDQNTSAYVQIIKSVYVPGLLNITAEQIQSELAATGSNFISFQPDGNYGYTLLYQSFNNDVLYNYIEVNRIELQNCVRIVTCVPAEVYKQFEAEIDYMIASVSWNPAYPIPADYILAYNPFGNFEFAVPAAWSREIENNEYVARDPYTGAEMHVSVSESSSNYAGVNQALFAEYLSAGKESFSINQFTCTDNLIYCVSSYTINTFPVYRVEYLLATGVYEYAICFICPTSYFSEISPMFDQAFSLFRTF